MITMTLLRRREDLDRLNVPIDVPAVLVLGDVEQPDYVLSIDQLRDVLRTYDEMAVKEGG